VSCVGLTLGVGGEGARMTSRMFVGGWLYPEGSAKVATDKDEVDCAATGAGVIDAASAATKRQVKLFWAGISSICLGFMRK
jgi:hypothetical protein